MLIIAVQIENSKRDEFKHYGRWCNMLTCGIDIGARTIDIALFDSAQILESCVIDTGAFPKKNAMDAFENILRMAGVTRSDVDRTIATGYGRNYFEEADRAATEILCHAKGVAYLIPSVRTIIDTGGVARNEGVLQALKQETGNDNIKVPPEPQITGALGAAIIAMEDLHRERIK